MQAGIRGYLIANGHDGMIVDMGDAMRGSGNSIDDTFAGNNIIKLKGPDVPDLAPRAADEAAPVADDLPRSPRAPPNRSTTGWSRLSLPAMRISWLPSLMRIRSGR